MEQAYYLLSLLTIFLANLKTFSQIDQNASCSESGIIILEGHPFRCSRQKTLHFWLMLTKRVVEVLLNLCSERSLSILGAITAIHFHPKFSKGRIHFRQRPTQVIGPKIVDGNLNRESLDEAAGNFCRSQPCRRGSIWRSPVMDSVNNIVTSGGTERSQWRFRGIQETVCLVLHAFPAVNLMPSMVI